MSEDNVIARVSCRAGHVYELGQQGIDFTPPDEVIACFAPCQEMVVKPEQGNLVLPCGELVVWRRKPNVDRPKMRILRNAKQRLQLDMFLDDS